jgi:hypothetical protein
MVTTERSKGHIFWDDLTPPETARRRPNQTPTPGYAIANTAEALQIDTKIGRRGEADDSDDKQTHALR